ncbi:MAG TPA: hypothetical protein VIT91_03455 [Chthoniobacterales bacterium]
MPLEIPSGPPLVPHNQTPPNWIPTNNEPERGAGFFLVLDPDADSFPPLRAVVFRDITYAQCLLLGEMAASFKWVPPSKLDQIDSPPPACVGRCGNVGHCLEQLHCWCIEGRCKLKPLTT